MKKFARAIRCGHVWNNYVVQRATLTIGSLAALVAASGAGSHWH